MKLYNLEASYNSRKVRAVAEELGIELEIINPNVMKGEHKQPEFLAKNPNAVMPVLEDGDFILWESNAILLYLADTKPESMLSPKSVKQRADINRWLFWDSCNLNKTIGAVTYELVLKKYFKMGDPDMVKVEQGQKTLNNLGKILNTHLEKNEYVAGSLSVADLSLAADLAIRNLIGFNENDFPNLKSWLERIESRDSWKKSESEMKL